MMTYEVFLKKVRTDFVCLHSLVTTPEHFKGRMFSSLPYNPGSTPRVFSVFLISPEVVKFLMSI